LRKFGKDSEKGVDCLFWHRRDGNKRTERENHETVLGFIRKSFQYLQN
jgi:hypothetical protein